MKQEKLLIILIYLISFQSFSQNDKDYREYPMIPCYYTLPINYNGLSETSFKVYPKIRLERWSDKSDIIFSMDCVPATANSPTPYFKYSYNFGGKQYGELSVGFDPFKVIVPENIRFEVTVTYGSKSWTKNDVGEVGTTIMASIEKDAKVSEIFVRVKVVGIVFFTGNKLIEDKIQKILANENAKKDYNNLITRANNLFNAKNWFDAKKNYQLASNLFPSESYPKSQIAKIEDEENRVKVVEENRIKQEDARVKESKTANATNSSIQPQNSTANEDNSFWTEKPVPKREAIPDQPLHKNLPDFVRTTDGGYFYREKDGKFREVTMDEYNAARTKANASKAQDINAPEVTRAEVKTVEDIFKEAEVRNQEINALVNRKVEAWQQSFYHAEAIRNSKQKLANLRVLSGDYESIEQLKAEFNEKFNAISEEVKQLEASRNSNINNAVNANFYGNSTEVAIGQGIQLIGSIVNSAKANKEEREAKEALIRAKEEQKAEFKKKKKQYQISLRKNLLTSFPDGGTPLTGHKITSPEVYMFTYIIDLNTLEAEILDVSVSNVFTVRQYSDGTFPYKTSLKSKLSGYAKGDIIMVGFYLDKQNAEQMQKTFINLAKKSNYNVKTILIKEANKEEGSPAAKTSENNFWDN